jgi:hypothetical protein
MMDILQPQHTQHAQIPRQLALVPHGRERGIRIRVCFCAARAHGARDGVAASLHHLVVLLRVEYAAGAQ